MKPMHPLIAHFQQYLPLSEEEKEMIAARASRRQVKRRQMILQEGFTCRHYTFVAQGCFHLILALSIISCSTPAGPSIGEIVTVTGGQISGALDSESGIRSFKGIPFAVPTDQQARIQMSEPPPIQWPRTPSGIPATLQP